MLDECPRERKTRVKATANKPPLTCNFGAEDGIRTRDPNLGKVVRYRCATSAWTTKPSFPLPSGETRLARGIYLDFSERGGTARSAGRYPVAPRASRAQPTSSPRASSMAMARSSSSGSSLRQERSPK